MYDMDSLLQQLGWDTPSYLCFILEEYEFDDGEEFVLMQSTGLKDKNGVEVFEGDVVKYHEEEICLVTWDQDGFAFSFENLVDNENSFCDCFDIAAAKYSEVIGNVFQNPDLLPNF